MPLYKLETDKVVSQIKPASFASERELQRLFEANLPQLLGVRLIGSEFTTGDRQRGRIDTLGLDQDGYPTIIEYKKSNKENVINQGLFYLDWLVDHKGDFTIAAQETLGAEVEIDWSNPRLILIAENFSEYDKYAVNRIGANIELWTYRLYGENLLHLNAIFVTSTQPVKKPNKKLVEEQSEKLLEAPIYSVEDHLKGKSKATQELFLNLRERIFTFGDQEEITEKANKLYVSYKHGKNFCEVKIQSQGLKMWLDISPEDLRDPLGLGKDMRNIGHHGTGDVEVKLMSHEDIDHVIELVNQAYNQTI